MWGILRRQKNVQKSLGSTTNGSDTSSVKSQEEDNNIRRSSSASDDSEGVEAESCRRELEDRARVSLDRAKSKTIAFAVRANVGFNGSVDDDSPLPGYAVSFDSKSFLHVIEEFNEEWWIGRVVKVGAGFGFVPSPTKFENLKLQSSITSIKSIPRTTARSISNQNYFSYYVKEASTFVGATASGIDEISSPRTVDITCEDEEEFPDVKEERSGTGLSGIRSKRILFKKMDSQSPYDIVPIMRPIVLVGPSLKQYEVTDMLHKALLDYLKQKFAGRIAFMKVTADFSLAKKMTPQAASKIAVMEKNSNKFSGLVEVSNTVKRVFEMAKNNMQLLVLESDAINHPSQISKTNLAPLIFYVKIDNVKVLQRLIKSRGKSQSKYMNAQLVAAEKLQLCNEDQFAAILNENLLREACEHLGDTLEEYWLACHPPSSVSRNQSANCSPARSRHDTLHNVSRHQTPKNSPKLPQRLHNFLSRSSSNKT
ncbi:Voltage-dependent L-type calcium channel subunit beta-2 [Trichoplax sp. H2]|nr:Voltage-dependent L-type calcium channel subunit beta-2 [Trichoplax sp. H2]|eukprot:RDD39934.1 Voltage-dependent L-type calcium channel subunit beta-2 [Trichoplax sp. H2]